MELIQCQPRFEAWRLVYNLERPHEALGMAVPAIRYRESPRSFPEQLPAIEYGRGDLVRKVSVIGKINFRHRSFRVGKAFRGEWLALRPTVTEGLWEVYFGQHRIARVNLREPAEPD